MWTTEGRWAEERKSCYLWKEESGDPEAGGAARHDPLVKSGQTQVQVFHPRTQRLQGWVRYRFPCRRDLARYDDRVAREEEGHTGERLKGGGLRRNGGGQEWRTRVRFSLQTMRMCVSVEAKERIWGKRGNTRGSEGDGENEGECELARERESVRVNEK